MALATLPTNKTVTVAHCTMAKLPYIVADGSVMFCKLKKETLLEIVDSVLDEVLIGISQM